MRDLNKVMVIGNLTRDPELRTIPSGQSVATFTVAANRSWINANRERQDAVEYVDAVAWGKLAELISQTLHKGRKVYIEGRLQTRSWDGPDGSKRFKTEVIVTDIIFLDRPGRSLAESIPSEPSTLPSEKSLAKEQPSSADQSESEEEINLGYIPF